MEIAHVGSNKCQSRLGKEGAPMLRALLVQAEAHIWRRASRRARIRQQRHVRSARCRKVDWSRLATHRLSETGMVRTESPDENKVGWHPSRGRVPVPCCQLEQQQSSIDSGQSEARRGTRARTPCCGWRVIGAFGRAREFVEALLTQSFTPVFRREKRIRLWHPQLRS